MDQNPLTSLPIIPYAIIFLIFYFLVIKPQKEKQKSREELLKNIQKNDEIITSAGIHGTIVQLKDKTVIVRVDDNVKIEFDRESIASVTKSKS